ncbi:MAG: cytochrome c [Gammaproteobacteria bacterium]|nr:cytochrome c [Gammaproteobacteria bacterium]
MRSATLLLMLTWFAAGAAAGTSPYADYSGRELYARFCASCHGEAGFGDGPVAPALKVLVPDLTRLYQRSGGQFPDPLVRRIIDGRQIYPAHGSRVMPVWGQELWIGQGANEEAGEEVGRMVDRLVDYLRSIQQ